MGRGVSSSHRTDAQEDLEGVLHVSTDCGFLGEKEFEEQVTPMLVIRERRHKMTRAMIVPKRGTEFPWTAEGAVKFIDQLLGVMQETVIAIGPGFFCASTCLGIRFACARKPAE